jgi:hypothetical protein
VTLPPGKRSGEWESDDAWSSSDLLERSILVRFAIAESIADKDDKSNSLRPGRYGTPENRSWFQPTLRGSKEALSMIIALKLASTLLLDRR